MRTFDLVFLASIVCLSGAFVKDKRCESHGAKCVPKKTVKKNCKELLPNYICPRGKICCKRMMDVNNNNVGAEAKRKKCRQSKKCKKRNGICVAKKDGSCQSATDNTLCLGQSCTCCLVITGDPEERITTCHCGQANEEIRTAIVPAQNKYPWLVGIINENIHKKRVSCSGAIIADRYILTAAHCMVNFSSGDIISHSNIKVILSQHGQVASFKTSVKKLIIHKNYNHENRENDIGLVMLKKPMNLTTFGSIRPICLPVDENKIYTPEKVILAGWSGRNGGSSTLGDSRDISVRILSLCQESIPLGIQNTETVFCGLQEGEREPCFGDSGGPLAVKEGTSYTIVGVVSIGSGCGQLKTPVVYTKVSKYLDWIKENTLVSKYCSDNIDL